LISKLQTPGGFLGHLEMRRIYPGNELKKILPDWGEKLQDIFC
jgi:hypothetical protein